MDTIDTLTAEYQTWCAAQGLPEQSADEFLLDANALSPYERAYIDTFIKRWETAMELDRLQKAIAQIWDLAQDVCEMDGPHARDTLIDIQQIAGTHVVVRL